MGLADYQDDHLFDSGSRVNSLGTIRASLPSVVTSGSTIVVDGVPKFKASTSTIGHLSGNEGLQNAIELSESKLAVSKLRELLSKRLQSLSSKNQPISIGELSQELGEVSGLLHALANLEPEAEVSMNFDFGLTDTGDPQQAP